MKTIYFIFSDTGTWLSRAIKLFVSESLNHTSIAFDESLDEVYSFGRTRPKNPFLGGFVRENIRGDLMRNANCAVYAFNVSNEEYEEIRKNIKLIEESKSLYRYNFIGLLGVLFNIEINRQYAFFCSQFVAYVTRDIASLTIEKPLCFATPADIRDREGMHLIYRGKLGEYAATCRLHKSEALTHIDEKKKVITI